MRGTVRSSASWALFMFVISVASSTSAQEPSDEGESERATSEVEEIANGRRERRHVLHNSWSGSVGGLHVVDAGSGAVGAFRVHLSGRLFVIDDWLADDDHHRHFMGNLGVSWTASENVEIYGFAGFWQNTNNAVDRRFFQLTGETWLGVKAFHRFHPIVTAGADLAVGLPLNRVVDSGTTFRSTNVSLRANLAFDLRDLLGREARIPFIARLNVGYMLDNTAQSVRALERSRYDALPTEGEEMRRPIGEEDRHLITPVERFGYQVDRRDRVTLGVGFEWPIELAEHLVLSPIAEWVLSIPVDRRGDPCPPSVGVGSDACLADRGFGAYRQSVSVGARLTPRTRDFSVFVAADVGLTGVRTPVRELAAQHPYAIYVGLAYAYDPRAPGR
ncbi:MAG: hypothetical protein KF901_24800 [Myxococcales bacterium]|nr:hypothetical protein [Myxococcales bacterium]